MFRVRNQILMGSLGALALVVVLQLHPVNSTSLKLINLGGILAIWVGLTIFFWSRKKLRIAFLMIPVLVAIPFVLPGRTIDQEKLRQDYLKRLSEFEGTKYIWGGENSLGIDCSGLPRRAYRDALLQYGFRSANGRAFRSWLEQWWYDASARALGEGYRDNTVSLEVTGTIREMDYEGLEPGDLAVTSGGAHILVYLGEGQWIQADPGLGKVATLDGRTAQNVWFGIPVTTHRWMVFSEVR